MVKIVKELNYEIIGSGSSGNCVIIEDMMFDCGVPYGHIKDKLYDIKYLFITHRHSDHIKPNTVNGIIRNFPRIKIIGNYDVARIVPTYDIVGDVTELDLGDRTVQAFKCYHDVPTTGFVINMNDINFIYATDTASLEDAPDEKYDYMFIESNHDEKKIEAIRNNSKKIYGYDVWKGAKRHLSTQKSREFYYLHRRNKDSKWIELHKSKRFY